MLAAVMALMIPALVDVPKDRVSIGVRMQITRTDGGDGGSVFGMVPAPLEAGKPTTMLFGRTGNCAGSIQFGGSFPAGIANAWRVQITPLKVTEMDTVTFRLAWATAVDGRFSSGVEEAIQLTLRPGQSVPIEVQPWTSAGQGCGGKHATLMLSVDPPPREMDRQLVLTDLWLVDKVAGGVERTQRLALRGRFGEMQRFYFDDINGTGRVLDLSGEILVLAREDGVDLQITTQRRRMAYDGGARDVASATSRVHLRPNDTAAVELPKSVYESDPFLGHELSLRIQSREIRGAAGVQSTSVFVAPPGKREK